MNETGNENKPKTPFDTQKKRVRLSVQSLFTELEHRARTRESLIELAKEQAARAEFEAKEKFFHEQAMKQPSLDLPPDALLTLEHVKGYADRVRDNDILAEYYRELYEETEDPVFLNKAQSIGTCARQWFFDHYRLQRVRDLKNIFLCKDKFCLNCQALQQAVRLSRFSPILEQLTSEGKYIYHAVFTCTNVPADKLSATVKKMKSCFREVIRLFQGHLKSSYNFRQYGFLGGVRGLEVTTDNGYHVHFHSALAFDKPLFKEKDQVNKFSYDYRKTSPEFVRNFSRFEILIQKVWYCLMNDIPVTRENVDNLKAGYSVTFDEVAGTVYEVFKYVIKFEKDDNGRLKMTYEQFRALYFALRGVHVFQGYGCFRNVAAPIMTDEELEKYNVIIARLRLVEDPVEQYEPINEVMTRIAAGNQRYITRRTVDAFIRNNPDFMASLSDGKITTEK